MAITDFYKNKANVERQTRIENSVGTWEEVWTVVHNDVACCIQPRKGYEFVAHDKVQSDTTHVMYCDVMEIRPSDRIVAEGITFDVLDGRDIDFLGRFLTIDLKNVVTN